MERGTLRIYVGTHTQIIKKCRTIKIDNKRFLLVQLEKSIPVLSLQKVLVHNLSKKMFIGGSVVHSTNNSYLIKKLIRDFRMKDNINLEEIFTLIPENLLASNNEEFKRIGKFLIRKNNLKILHEKVNQASKDLAEERGACPDAAEYGYKERFSNKTAIAPTASISIICGGASPGVEPIAANSYTHKTLSGSFNVRNRYLEEILQSHGKNDEETWSSITTNQGSVNHLDFLTDLEKDVFKTAFELNQNWIIELSGDRTPFISQAQSVNLFLPADVHKKELHKIHFDAWKKGLKSLYYCRSKSIQRAENVNDSKSTDILANVYKNKSNESQEQEYEECLSCQ